MVQESIFIDGPELSAIRATAKTAGVIVSVGLSEKARYSSGTLFNSNVLIGSDGEVLVHHRKLMPTFFEKLTWSPGDGYGLRVAETKWGRIGGLICGENTNPLARYALMAQGEQVHVSTWPAVWPTRVPSGAPTTPPPAAETIAHTDSEELAPSAPARSGAARDSGANRNRNYDNVTANRTRAAAHCFEAKCFGILCSSFLDAAAINIIAEGAPNPELVRAALEQSPRGASMFLDPTGAVLPAFTVDSDSDSAGRGEVKMRRKEGDMLQNEEGLLVADMDLEECVEGKQYHDVVGGYQRFDVFELRVDRRRREPAVFRDCGMHEGRAGEKGREKDGVTVAGERGGGWEGA